MNKKVMRFYEVNREDLGKLRSRFPDPGKLICSAIMNMQVQPVTAQPQDAVKIRLYLTKEEFKTLDRSARVAGVSSASIVKGIVAYLAGNPEDIQNGKSKGRLTDENMTILKKNGRVILKNRVPAPKNRNPGS